MLDFSSVLQLSDTFFKEEQSLPDTNTGQLPMIMLKYSLNHLNRKLKLIQFAGGSEAAQPHRTAIYLVGASIAEFFADVLLTPCEAVRIRLVSDSKYASGFLPAFARMAKEGGAREMCMSSYLCAFIQ